ncbi:hypothetical protein [Streptomyces mirabilis]|uniref:hypothetical protein n=1 Tax=Streptomyces mirabilis TaxID=68239 RepID=UPI00332F30A2
MPAVLRQGEPLVQHVGTRRGQLTALPEAGRSVPLGGAFTLNGRRYNRTGSPTDRRKARLLEDPAVGVVDHGTGETTDVTMAEEVAFKRIRLMYSDIGI